MDVTNRTLRPARSGGAQWRVAKLASSLGLLLLSSALVAPARATNPAPDKHDALITEASRHVGRCFAHEDPHCARPWISKLEKRVKGSQAVAYARGYERLLSGALAEASALLNAVARAGVVPTSLRSRAVGQGKLAAATAALTAKMIRRKLLQGRFEVWLTPGRDEVLVPLLEPVLGKAVVALEAAFGPMPPGPLRIHVYRKVEDLASVSGLTAKQIRNSGTIALCKYNRLMLTSPADLLFGYAWADTVVHELVHWFIIRKAGAGVPIWLHEGLARSFEASWRDADPVQLGATELGVLAKARRRKRFIPFSKMSPTMAALPDQASTQLAFAEVHHAVAWILEKTRRKGATGPVDARPLLARFAAGDDEAKALGAVLGTSRKAALAAWRRDLLAGRGAHGVLPAAASKRPASLRFKRHAGPDPFKGLGSQARRWVELGDRLLAINRPHAAVIEYRKALGSGAKRTPLMMHRMARALIALRRYDDARKVAEETLASHEGDAAMLQLLAAALSGQGKHAAALQRAKQSAWINPYDCELHELTAKIHTAMAAPAKAAKARALAAIVRK